MLFLVACSKRQETIINRENVPVFSLNGTWLESDSLLYTSNIYPLENGYFASIIYRLEDLLHIYQIQENNITHISSAIKQGNGPFEMGVPCLAYDKKNKELILSDLNTRNTLIVDASDPTSINKIEKWERSNMFSVHTSFFLDRILIQPDSSFLLLGAQHGIKSFIALMDRKKSTIQPLYGFWPEDDYKGSIIVKQNEYQSNAILQKRPSSNRYFYTSENGWYAEFFSIQDSQIINRKTLFPIYPAYKTNDGLNRSHLPHCRMGMRVHSNDSHIYISLNPPTFEQWLANREVGYNYNNEILIYNWEGDLKQILQLDVPVNRFFVDEKEKNLYGIALDGEDYKIRRFQLNN